ncbi:MAG: STAS domain-containing protein [Armatimonadota bacterium]|nr:STAS domain-containing protein [Armatimonadota bacterium]
MTSKEIFQIGVNEIGTTRVLRLIGDLDSYTSRRLLFAVDSWIDNVEKLLVNLDQIEYIDSTGLAALVAIWVEAEKRGVRFILSCKNSRVYRVLEITGLLNLFNLAEGSTTSVPIAGGAPPIISSKREQKTPPISGPTSFMRNKRIGG